MTINFDDVLTSEQKKSIIAQSIQQFVIERYKLELNRKVVERQPDNSDGLALIDKDVNTILQALEIYQTEFDSL